MSFQPSFKILIQRPFNVHSVLVSFRLAFILFSFIFHAGFVQLSFSCLPSSGKFYFWRISFDLFSMFHFDFRPMFRKPSRHDRSTSIHCSFNFSFSSRSTFVQFSFNANSISLQLCQSIVNCVTGPADGCPLVLLDNTPMRRLYVP